MMNQKLMRYVAMVALVLPFVNATAQTREEFNGPMKSWADAKKRFGVKGDGKSDDTKALQKAIDSLSTWLTLYNMGKEAYAVLYLPAGTYCITSTLVLRGKMGVSIIGEDPSTTKIKWIGPQVDTMLWANGSSYYKISRLTWDGGKKLYMRGIGIHWKDKWNDNTGRSFAPLNIEVSDCRFIGLTFGIFGGTFGGEGTGANDSEVTIKRCVFEECVDSGISIQGFNALDYWIWDCKFINCWLGIHNRKGNYHVYRSYFTGSRWADIHTDNGYYTSMRSCFTEKGGYVSQDAGKSCNPFKRIFQDNIILNQKNTPVEFYHPGKVTFWQNTLTKTANPDVNFIVDQESWCPAVYQIMSIKNVYESSQASFKMTRKPLQRFTIADKYVPKVSASAAAFLKNVEVTPAIRKRKVFEVPVQASAQTIQSIINQAAALKGQRPVVHFGVGHWMIDRTLTIPAGSDMQLLGDGLVYASVLSRVASANFQNAPLIQVNGPSYITIKDLQIGLQSDKEFAAAIVFVNVDQPQSQAHLDQIHSSADTALISDKQDYLYIEKNNSFFSDGNYVNGGSLTRQGRGTAKVVCYGGQFARVFVNNGGRFLAKDCWWEGSPRVPVDLKGSGEVTIDGAMIAPREVDSLPTIRIGEFNGKISLLNLYLQGSVSTDPGNAGLKLLLWNINFYHKLNPYEYIKEGRAAKIAMLGGNAQCFDKRKACEHVWLVPDKQYRVNDLSGFIDEMTEFSRTEKPVLYKDLAAGVSNIFLSRVSFGNCRRGVVFSK